MDGAVDEAVGILMGSVRYESTCMEKKGKRGSKTGWVMEEYDFINPVIHVSLLRLWPCNLYGKFVPQFLAQNGPVPDRAAVQHVQRLGQPVDAHGELLDPRLDLVPCSKTERLLFVVSCGAQACTVVVLVVKTGGVSTSKKNRAVFDLHDPVAGK